MRSERRRGHALAVRVRRTRPAFAALVTLAFPVAAAAAPGPQPAPATVCAACHGEGGRSSAPAFPNLAGQQAEYLQKQLIDFAKGRRRNKLWPPPLKQVPLSAFPPLFASYAAEPPPPGRVGDAALAEVGRRIFEEGDWPAGIPPCRSCHGERGAGSERYPRL